MSGRQICVRWADSCNEWVVSVLDELLGEMRVCWAGVRWAVSSNEWVVAVGETHVVALIYHYYFLLQLPFLGLDDDQAILLNYYVVQGNVPENFI